MKVTLESLREKLLKEFGLGNLPDEKKEEILSKMVDLREKLLKEFGLGNLPDEKKEEILPIMVEAVLKEAFLKIAERMSDEDCEYFDSLLRNESAQSAQAALEKFMKKIAPDPDTLVSEIISNFRDKVMLNQEGGNHIDDTIKSSMDWTLIENEAEFLQDKTVRNLLTESEVRLSLEDHQVKTNFHRDSSDMASRRTFYSWIHNLFSNIFGKIKMFGFTRNSQRWGVNELKIDLLEKDADLKLLSDEKREELLAMAVSMILKNVFRDNLYRFSGVERDMLEGMFDENTVSLENIEDYLRQKIPKFDKSSKNILDGFYRFKNSISVVPTNTDTHNRCR